MTPRGQFSDEELTDLHLEAFLEFEKEQEDKGAIPRSETNLMARFRGFLVFLGAVNLALFVACLTVLLNFIVVRLLLHLDVSRYLG